MMDRFRVVASVATKLRTAVAASYLRGRDERRMAYRRFRKAAIACAMEIRDSRRSPEAIGPPQVGEQQSRQIREVSNDPKAPAHNPINEEFHCGVYYR